MKSFDSLVAPNPESMTDLPSMMRDKIEHCDEFDFLEPSTPTSIKNSLNDYQFILGENYIEFGDVRGGDLA